MRRKFYVEVCTLTGEAAIIKREPADNWRECIQVAREMTVAMFYDDPMSQRVFHNGRFTFRGTNDLGDTVIIRPVVQFGEERFKDVGLCPVKPTCEFHPECRESSS